MRVAALIALAAAAQLFFASCGGKGARSFAGAESGDAAQASAGKLARDSGGIIVGFSQIGAESAWRLRNSKSMKEAAASMGIQLLYSNAEQKQANQINAIRTFIVYRVDAIVFVPIVQYGWENVLNEAREANIPVIVADRKLRTSDPSLVAAFIGPDHREEGRAAARFLLQKYEESEGPLTIVELRGTDASSVSEDRAAGFRDELEGDARFKIVYSETGDFLRSKAREVLANFVEAQGGFVYGDEPVDILFSHNDGMTLGALEVLEECGAEPGKAVTIITVDGEQAVINALKAGKVNCVVECNPNLGLASLALARRAAAGESVEYFNTVPGSVFTEFDDLTRLPPRGY